MGLLNRYEKIRMDKDAIPKAESRNRSGGKKRMNRTIRVSAAGDILIMKRLLPGYQDVLPIREFLMQGEVRMANLETTISDGSCYASAYSGGTWLTADAKCLEDTLRYGFNFLGISNNHTMDYSYEGLASTISELKKKDVAYAGAGKNLYEASRPAVLDTTAGQIAVIDICSTFENAARAGSQTERQPGRPGLNPLRFSEKYTITEKHAQDLAKIAEVTGINGLRDLHRQEGFIAPLSEGVMEFGGKMFEISKDGTEGRSSSPNPIDVKRTVDAIREAKMTCEAVLVMVHSHEIRKLADFMRMYHDQDCLTCHLCFPDCIDGAFHIDRIRAGASSLCSVLADFKHFPAKFHDTLGKRSYKSLLPVQIPQSVDSGHLCNLCKILRMFLRNGIFFRKAQRI